MIKEKSIYLNIDMTKTGSKLKRLMKAAGYTPKMLQSYLQLSCPQPIYRWYKGLILPSVNHLLMLSELLGIHMEELLVKKNFPATGNGMSFWKKQDGIVRYIIYYSKIHVSTK